MTQKQVELRTENEKKNYKMIIKKIYILLYICIYAHCPAHSHLHLFEGNTHKVEVCIVQGCLLFAVVQYNNDWVDQITGKADVRQRSPQA